MADTSLITKSDPDTVLLRPSRGWSSLNLRELWVYRELIYFLTWRDVIVRYKQTVLGFTWAIINPLINMVVLQVVFGNFAGMGTEGGVPGPIFRFAAVLPWGLFSTALGSAGRSMLSNRSILTKVYFPRLIIPLSSVLSGLVDFGISLIFLIGMMFFFGVKPSIGLVTLPLIILLALVAALGIGLWLSSLNVLYRDVGYVLPVLTQLLLFISPVGYSTSQVPIALQPIYALNPVVGVVEGFRWVILGTVPSDSLQLWILVAISSTTAIFLLITGLFYFRRMERIFADMV